MFIQTESTPNPATLKFLPGCEVTSGLSVDFRDTITARQSPLAQRLFDIEGVTAVFLGHDFVTVAKKDTEDWQVLKPLILSAIMEHFVSGQPILLEDYEHQDHAVSHTEEDAEIVDQIKDLLDNHVRPVVANDGGDIIFHGFDRGIVYLTMRGSCAGCPSSIATLKVGIENLLRHYIPEVVEVRQCTD